MSSYITKSKEAVKRIITTVRETLKDGTGTVQFAFVAYRDHHAGEEYVTKMKNFCNESEITSFINTLSAGGGGDGPEAVLDGLYDSIFKSSWRKDSQKYLFHIADAPPHGTQYVSGGDTFPGGCPCGVKIETLASKLKELNIRYLSKSDGFSF